MYEILGLGIVFARDRFAQQIQEFCLFEVFFVDVHDISLFMVPLALVHGL